MWVRYALALAAIALASCASAAGSERARHSGGAEADHRRCVDYYRLKPGSTKYAECRKQLARQPREEPQRRQPEERSIWSFQNPVEFNCKFWGSTPGTADWDECVRVGELNRARRKGQEQNQKQLEDQNQKQLEEQQMICLRTGMGLITSIGGSTYQVNVQEASAAPYVREASAAPPYVQEASAVRLSVDGRSSPHRPGGRLHRLAADRRDS
jgi:hypothetical protein